MNKLDNDRIKQASQYIAAAALCVLFLFFFYKLWRADLRVPFFYSGDSIYYAMCIKGIIENGSYWQNPFVGAPGGLQMYDFPGWDNAVVGLLLLISIFSRNQFLVMNVFFLLSFPLVTLASLYVLRQYNLSYVPALFSSILYAFLPYHFMRNQNHLILCAYYVIPLAVLVLLWLTTQDLVPRTKKFMFSVLICILLGCSGVYYPFFFCFLLLVAGAIGALKLQRLRPLALALVLVGITSATVAVNLSPSIIYKYKHGDVGTRQRSPGDAEVFGLKISQLLFPITAHRVGFLNRIKTFHNANTIYTENDSSSLGIVGSIGFLGLLAQLLYRKELVSGASGLFHDLSVLNIFAVLLGTIGGFGLLFAVLITNGVRSYNRVCVFIAFFSLMAVAIAVESIYRRSTKARSLFYLLLAVALIVGFLDQTTPRYAPNYALTKAEFLSDEEFVNRIEASLPAGAMIFQLPYIQFPEAPRIHKMIDYDHFRGYVHSKNLRWSYGTIKNREADLGQQQVASLAVDELVQTLTFTGFSGIYVDRFGYGDNGAAMESELSKALQVKPLISPNGRLLFFNFADYSRSLREKYPAGEWEAMRELSVHPLLLDWKGGFSGLENGPNKSWRWCSNEGELHLRNRSQRPRTFTLQMSVATGHEQFDDLVMSGLISEQLKVNFMPQFYRRTVTVPPGESVIHFRSTAKRHEAPLDTRFLVFRIEDFKMTELQ